MSKGNNRDWGYVSYDVDDLDNEKLSYTSYEKSGSVNKYTDNGDGGHSHSFWKNSDDYESGKDPDYYRSESNDKYNPSEDEVRESGGCYLTSACMRHFQEKFDDNCYELTILRWFRDNFVSKEDVEHYYNVAPIIVKTIIKEEKSDIIYGYIYDNIVDYCVEQIEQGNYEAAYRRYKNSVLTLEKYYVRLFLEQNLVRSLKLGE